MSRTSPAMVWFWSGLVESAAGGVAANTTAAISREARTAAKKFLREVIIGFSKCGLHCEINGGTPAHVSMDDETIFLDAA